MKISIICPVYNGEKYIEELNNKLLNQKLDKNQDLEILYVVTRGSDKSESILNKLNCNYCVICPEEFSHGKTREMIAMKTSSDIIVFISQDVKMKDDFWLENLIMPIINKECEASFSRQICENNTIEKYIREKNYPEVSRVVSKKDIQRYGILTFFYSDAASAVDAEIYKKLKAYDGKNLIINEDMYFSHKLIQAGYKIKYCADSEVYHSHVFTFKQLFKRYFDTGMFFRENSYFFKYKGNESGIALAKYVLKRAIEERNIKVIINLLPNFGVRFIGKFLGERHKN
ncbi:glycosyl transferase family 2 [Clostridium sp. DL-VIII]|uniref:glycosyltransferase family 2 protein n=1 Tax=Clostridium sp. DL-VIII TaxID=641107 RepID=UPI00023B071E|nr:glycosyltransferase [Clostridium sp. DL-VIII]EHJ02111.1 glycosyl transferase family 2 [Clostridium sp. DL-VIII]